jgi:endonuclease/exonuclease/phosphatase (EEP) superfamily protein YafD
VITFLFWNLKAQPLRERLARLAVAHSVDVFVVAECDMQSGAVSRALSEATGSAYRVVPGSGNALRVFTRTPLANWRALFSDTLEAWLGFRFRAPNGPELLVFAVHMWSKLRTTSEDRMQDAKELAEDVRQLEVQEGHARTLVVGDFNVNPFEVPLVWSSGLHAVPDRRAAEREVRTIHAREYALMYNPTWGVMGDRTPGPSGTYYRVASESVNYFWNTYDQVLMRPALAGHLTELRVLDSDGTESLLTASGIPDAANGSDHLPLLFRFDW